MNTIFSAQTINANSPKFPSKGHFATLLAKGTWGGAVLTVEASPDDGSTWITTPVQLTADGVLNFIAGRGVHYRLTLSGATGTTNVSAWVSFEI